MKTLDLDCLLLESSHSKFIPSCTLTYDTLPSHKISSKSLEQFRRSCTYKKCEQTDKVTPVYNPTPNFVCVVYNASCKIFDYIYSKTYSVGTCIFLPVFIYKIFSKTVSKDQFGSHSLKHWNLGKYYKIMCKPLEYTLSHWY